MDARGFIPGSPGLRARWFGRFAVVELPPGKSILTAPALAGALCAVLDQGGAGLIVVLPGVGVVDSASLDVLLRTARRARGWGSWLRLAIPAPDARRLVRLVSLDAVMPVHTSAAGAIAAALREAAAAAAGG